jgi:hypothetical protein
MICTTGLSISKRRVTFQRINLWRREPNISSEQQKESNLSKASHRTYVVVFVLLGINAVLPYHRPRNIQSPLAGLERLVCMERLRESATFFCKNRGRSRAYGRMVRERPATFYDVRAAHLSGLADGSRSTDGLAKASDGATAHRWSDRSRRRRRHFTLPICDRLAQFGTKAERPLSTALDTSNPIKKSCTPFSQQAYPHWSATAGPSPGFGGPGANYKWGTNFFFQTQ